MCAARSSSGDSDEGPNRERAGQGLSARGQGATLARATSVVVLFDCLEARPEAVQYAAELSTRVESALVLLMLLRLDEKMSPFADAGALEASIEAAFAPHVKKARGFGVPVEAVLRIGDPYSELTKYLAETRAVHTIVWAGDRAVLSQKHRKEQPHWLARIRDTVDIPVVVPSLRP